MRVLFLTNIPTPYRVDFFNELGALCDLTVLYERRTARDRDITWLRNTAENYAEVYLPGIQVGNDSSLCMGVVKWVCDPVFDLVVIGGYGTPTGMLAIECLSARKVPFFLNADGGIIRSESLWRYKMKKHFISKATWWLSTSRETDRYLVHYGAHKSRIFRYPFTSVRANDIVHHALSSEEKKSLRSQLGITEDKIIVSVGRFIHLKGFDILLQACKFMGSNIGVYIIGGEPTSEYTRMKNELGLKNLHFIGFRQRNQLREYYLAADLFVLPTREDVWGLVVNEAMAHGLPVITTDRCVAGLELVQNGDNGFIVPVNDVAALSDRIESVLQDNITMAKMSSRSIEKIKEYTITNMASVHMKIFTDVLMK